MIRAFIFSICFLFLGACGFTPMHAGPSGAAFKDMKVTLNSAESLSDEQAGFFVLQRVRDRVGNTDTGAHELKITVGATRSGIGVTDQDVTSRYDTTLIATYSLTERVTGKVLDSGSVNSITTFGAPFDPYGVIAADTSAKQQAGKEIADRLLNTLARYYAQNRAP